MTPEDERQIKILVARVVAEELKKARVDHSGEYRQIKRELDADLRRVESDRDAERSGEVAGISMAFENMMREIRASRAEAAERFKHVEDSIRPTAKGAEDAAVAGANAAIGAQAEAKIGKSLASDAKRWAQLAALVSPLIVGVVNALIHEGCAQIRQWDATEAASKDGGTQ